MATGSERVGAVIGGGSTTALLAVGGVETSGVLSVVFFVWAVVSGIGTLVNVAK